jgi:hypothetical protein
VLGVADGDACAWRGGMFCSLGAGAKLEEAIDGSQRGLKHSGVKRRKGKRALGLSGMW